MSGNNNSPLIILIVVALWQRANLYVENKQ
jgi:hypothetical protein